MLFLFVDLLNSYSVPINVSERHSSKIYTLAAGMV